MTFDDKMIKPYFLNDIVQYHKVLDKIAFYNFIDWKCLYKLYKIFVYHFFFSFDNDLDLLYEFELLLELSLESELNKSLSSSD